jgi:hypothetical protein
MDSLITTPQAEWFSRIAISKRSAVSSQLSAEAKAKAKGKNCQIWLMAID